VQQIRRPRAKRPDFLGGATKHGLTLKISRKVYRQGAGQERQFRKRVDRKAQAKGGSIKKGRRRLNEIRSMGGGKDTAKHSASGRATTWWGSVRTGGEKAGRRGDRTWDSHDRFDRRKLISRNTSAMRENIGCLEAREKGVRVRGLSNEACWHLDGS